MIRHSPSGVRRVRHESPGWFLPVASALLSVACGHREPPVRNVLLISIDTLRADRLGCYGHDRPTSPQLDAFAEAGALFEDAASTAPWTLPAHASLLTGLYPDAHGARTEQHAMAEDVATLAEALRGRGFETHAVVNAFFVSPGYGLARGFGEYRYVREDQSRAGAARRITDLGIDWLGPRRGGRNFLFLHYFDVHSSYRSEERYERLFTRGSGRLKGTTAELREAMRGALELTPADVEHLKDLYDAGIRQLDDELGRLFRWLESAGWLEDTLVVVTSDHGEEFLDHGGLSHGHNHYQEMLRVPLIVRGPTIPAGKRLSALVSLIDVAPTILSVLGVAAPAGTQGRDLRPLWQAPEQAAADRPIFAETGPMEEDALRTVRSGRHKLILDLRTQRYELYDLIDDPRETRNLIDERPEVVGRLAPLLTGFIQESRRTPKIEPSAEDRQLLEALGYL
jgi:arylsulfatase A-like enzyme